MCLPVQSLLAGEDTDNVSTGGFGEIVYKHGSFENESGGILGLRGAVIRNQKVNLGIGMYLLASEIESPYNSGNGRMIYGGLELGYIRDMIKSFHWSFNCLFGGGFEFRKIDAFLVFEPNVSVEYNFTPHTLIEMGIGTRTIISISESNGINTEKYKGGTFIFGIKFGGFGL